MSIFPSRVLPRVVARKSKNLLELLEKNGISSDNVRRVVIGPVEYPIISKEIAQNALLISGQFVEISIDSRVYFSGQPSDS